MEYCKNCGALQLQRRPPHLIVIVDRSGSMRSCHEATINGFNKLVEEQKYLQGDTLLTLVQFDTEYEVLFKDTPLHLVGRATGRWFTPRGNTALLDAIGKTLDTGSPSEPKIVCIITDGEENSSSQFSQEQIRSLTKSLDSRGWTFIYQGANQDAFKIGRNLGMTYSSNYTGDPIGTQCAYASMSNAVSAIRSGGAVDSSFEKTSS